MKLTRERALAIATELWEWLAETGKEKDDWPGWEKYGWMDCGCPLCQYDSQHLPRVKEECNCPFGNRSDAFHLWNCYSTSCGAWGRAKLHEKKQYAAEFLKELRGIKIPKGSWVGCYWKQKKANDTR